MNSISLLLPTQKKKKKKKGQSTDCQILHVTFCKFFFFKISKIEMVSQTIIFVFSILKIFLKSGNQTCKI